MVPSEAVDRRQLPPLGPAPPFAGSLPLGAGTEAAVSRFGGLDDELDRMSSEELERYVEARLDAIDGLWQHAKYGQIPWHVDAARAACARWRHVGTQVSLFDPASVAPRGLHAVDPVSR